MVLRLLGSHTALRPGQGLDDADAGFFYLIEGELTIGRDEAVLDTITTDHSGLAFAGLSNLLGTHTSDVIAVRAATPSKLLKVCMADMNPLILHAHRGAVKLIQRLGSLFHERINAMDKAVRGRRASGEAPEAALEEWLGVQRSVLHAYSLLFHSLGRKGKLEFWLRLRIFEGHFG